LYFFCNIVGRGCQPIEGFPNPPITAHEDVGRPSQARLYPIGLHR